MVGMKVHVAPLITIVTSGVFGKVGLTLSMGVALPMVGAVKEDSSVRGENPNDSIGGGASRISSSGSLDMIEGGPLRSDSVALSRVFINLFPYAWIEASSIEDRPSGSMPFLGLIVGGAESSRGLASISSLLLLCPGGRDGEKSFRRSEFVTVLPFDEIDAGGASASCCPSAWSGIIRPCVACGSSCVVEICDKRSSLGVEVLGGLIRLMKPRIAVPAGLLSTACSASRLLPRPCVGCCPNMSVSQM